MLIRFFACTATALAVNLALASAIAQVMGLQMGESISSIKNKGVQLTPAPYRHMYKATNLPQPVSIIPSVLLIVHPRFGLCTIQASSTPHDDNEFGWKTRSLYDGIKTALVAKYSKPTNSYDFVTTKSAWGEDNQFMISLEKEDRKLETFWFKSKGAELPQNIEAIAITSVAVSPSQGLIRVKYESNRKSECVNSIDPSTKLTGL